MWDFAAASSGAPTSGQVMPYASNLSYPFGGQVSWNPQSVTNGSYVPTGSQIGYVDTATPKGTEFGWDDPRAQGSMTRDVTRYQGGLTRELMNNNTAYLNNQMGAGFNNTMTGMENLFEQYGNYGGMYGNSSSPVYSPNAGATNGYSGLFNIGSF